MNDIAIETGVPLPPDRYFGPRPTKYPFPGMDVNDSFFVPVSDAEPLKLLRRRMRQSATWAGKRYAPAQFRSAAVEDGSGVRVWRIA